MAMISSWRWRAKALLFLLIAAGVGAVWFGLAHDRAASPLVVAASSAAPAGGPAVPVTEGRAETRDMPIWLSGIGSVQPLNTVTVKVRVDGQLDRVAHRGPGCAQGSSLSGSFRVLQFSCGGISIR